MSTATAAIGVTIVGPGEQGQHRIQLAPIPSENGASGAVSDVSPTMQHSPVGRSSSLSNVAASPASMRSNGRVERVDEGVRRYQSQGKKNPLSIRSITNDAR